MDEILELATKLGKMMAADSRAAAMATARKGLENSPSDRQHLSEYEIVENNAPSPGIAAVLSVLAPGLGQVYSGRLLAGGLWFLATVFGYSAVLVPGFLIHALCVLSAYQSARRWSGY